MCDFIRILHGDGIIVVGGMGGGGVGGSGGGRDSLVCVYILLSGEVK